MVPRSLLRPLNRLRRRERWLRLTWAVARWVAVFAVTLTAACLVDFAVDLYRDTPRWLRVLLLGVQMALWLAGCVFVLRSLVRRLSDTQVALWIEDKMPELGHRLISAVQLNRPGAATQGMSPVLIAAVTRQAEEQADATDFARLADARRLKWTAQLLAPLALAFALLFLLWPDTVRVLLARQLLEDRPIPRSLAIESASAYQVWPAGEEGVLRFRVRGAFSEQLKGEVRMDAADGSRERHELLFEARDESGEATFIARVPPSSRDFTYLAWLKDGRTHEPADVHFEPRPVVRRQQAWVQLPAYIGLKPSGRPFEEPQKGADIVFRLAGSAARVAIETQKPIVKATVEVLGPPHSFTASVKTGTRAETVRRSVDLTVQENGCQAEGAFSFQPRIRPEFLAVLAAGGGAGAPVSLPWAGFVLAGRGEALQTETAYRIVVRDEFGLENSDKPRRGIRSAPVDPPEVALLPEAFGKESGQEEGEIEGIPVLLDQRVPIAYQCSAVYGLSHARLRYRVVPRSASREDDPGEPREADFVPLPLGAPPGQAGKPGRKALEEFFTRPADDPDKVSGTEGGGRYDFDSSGIPDGKGGLLKLQEGDRIQFYVEVFGRADPDGPPGRSALREKEVVGQQDFLAWLKKKGDQEDRIRQLEEKQRAVAGTTSLLPDDRPRYTPQSEPRRERPGRQPEGENRFGRSWQLLGPFPNENDAGHAHAYPPETEKVDTLDLASEYDGLGGRVRWRPHHSSADKIDLQKFFDHGEAGVAYAVCWVKPAWRMKTILATGSDDGIKVWLNRKLVLDKAVHREAIPADDRTPIVLDDEWQEILVKVDNRFGTWAFYLDLLDPGTGERLPASRLSVRTTPSLAEKRFVKKWLVLGPFSASDQKGHGRVFPPEEGAVDLRRAYDGRRGKIRWKEYKSREDKISLRDACSVAFADTRGAVGYAAVWVRCERERSAVLVTGSEDGIKVWLNRKKVLDEAGPRLAAPDSERANVELASGWNEVLVKIDCNNYGHWAFYLELRDPQTGKPLSGVEYRTTPPEKMR
jgi:hypothetical protein